jgi:hypothetical protein
VLPDAWIVKIFDYMLGLYGSKFSDLWKGTDPAAVRRIWAEKLSGFRDNPAAIKAALDALDERPFPPTLPEFLTLCRDAARRAGTGAALPHYLSPDEKARADAAAAEALAAVSKAGVRDDMDWAKRPRSRLAMSVVFSEAKRGHDHRFSDAAKALVDACHATAEGVALRLWDGERWASA